MTTALLNALLRDGSTWLYVSGMFLSNVLLAWAALETHGHIVAGNAKSGRIKARSGYRRRDTEAHQWMDDSI